MQLFLNLWDLLEKLDKTLNLSPLNLIAECLKSKKHGAIATIFAVEGKVNLKIGSRYFVYPDDTTYTDIQNRELQQAIASDTITIKNNRQSTVNKYQLSSATVEVFIEAIKPPISLIIFVRVEMFYLW
jgi:hypothetical protein